MFGDSSIPRTAAALACACALLGSSVVSASAADQGGQAVGAVFVQSNAPTGNQVLVYPRSADGTLGAPTAYDTGGVGTSIQGAVVDPLASQSSLVVDAEHRLLIGVNGGSSSIYSFRIGDDGSLHDRSVVDAGDGTPVSVAVHGNLAYVLDAGGAGAVQGYRLDGNQLQVIPGSFRSLGLAEVTGPTAFVNTPGQVGFTPDGRKLIVTTKANGSKIDVFDVQADGRLSDTSRQNASATPVPFAFVFDPREQLVVAEAASSVVSTYNLNADDSLTTVASLADGQKALCWIVRANHDTYYVANAASGTLSGYHVDASGGLSLIGSTGVVATTGGGPVDLAASRDGRYVYAQLGGGNSLAELRVNDDGTLSWIGAIAGRAGMEGIAAI